MNTVRLKHSILAVENQLIPVDLVMWGEHKLTEADMASLTAASTNVTNYLTENNISIRILKETINNQDVDVGFEVVFPNYTEFTNTDAYKALYTWADRMRRDPDIKVFNWMEVIS